MDPAVPWQYTYNRLAAQGATSGDLHHHFTQAANNSALTSGHTSSQPLLGASGASFAAPSSFLSAPSYDAVFSPLFHHANPKPAHFNTINAAAQHRQQVLAAQAAATKQNSDSDLIRDNYTQHHSALSAPQSGSYFDQASGSAVASQLSAALGWQGRGQTDFSSLRSQSDLPSNNQLSSAFGILPHENVSSSPGPSTTAKSSTSAYESFNAHFPQPVNQANAIIKSSPTARSMSPQQQIKQQTIATTSAPSSVYYQPEQLQHQSHSNYTNSSNQAISGKNNRGGSGTTSGGNMQQSPISSHHSAQQPNLTLIGGANNPLSQHSHQAGHTHQTTSIQHSSSPSSLNQHPSAPQSNATSQHTNKNSMTDKKFPTPTGPGSGFMQSYLKFLQGERDTSPPPVNRGNSGARKTWPRANSTIPNQSKHHTNNGMQTVQDNKTLDTTKNRNYYQANNDTGNTNMMATSSYDRKRRPTYDSDDSSNHSNNKSATIRNNKKQSQQIEQQVQQQIQQQIQQPQQSQQAQQSQQPQDIVERAPQVPISQAAKKPRTTAQTASHINPVNLTPQQLQTALASQPITNPPQSQQILMQQHPNQTAAHQLVAGSSQILHQQQMYYEQEVPQRRETSRRKAKVSGNSSIKYNDFDDTELNESDSDPAWNDMPRRKTRKTRINSKQNKRNITRDNNSVSNSYNGDESKRNGLETSVTITPQSSNVGSSTTTTTSTDSPASSDPGNEFQSGNFIICRQDVLQDWPAMWRVDGKTLLQKFEPFQNNGKMIYRSISTYATWTPESRRLYLLAKCKYIGQFQHEMHVELLRNELCSDTADLYIEKVLQDTMAHQDQFEVYIQTLISQALDSNFLMEIMQEQDDYFLSNVKAIDKITTERKEKLQMTIEWPKRMLFSIETWPCYNVITDLGVTNNGQIICAGCNTSAIVSRIILYGQPYNANTIAPIQVDNRASYEKDFMLCRNCTARCVLYHKISHQKYLMFIECSRKVSQKNGQDPTKGSTAMLNELLADETWLAQLFKRTRCVWAEIDQIYRLHKSSN